MIVHKDLERSKKFKVTPAKILKFIYNRILSYETVFSILLVKMGVANRQ